MTVRDQLPRLLLLSALVALIMAGWGGLVRMGWTMQPFAVADHGPLMISGFLGTLISVERAVALSALYKKGYWAYIAPLFSTVGALGLAAGMPHPVAIGLMTLGSLALMVVFIVIVRHQTALFTVTMALGAACWLVGNVLWLSGQPIYQIVYWWVDFLILTIAGERLELTRILRHPRYTHNLFMIAAAWVIVSLVITQINLNVGVRLEGIGQIGLALWLLRYDIARKTIKQSGMTRYIGLCLMGGYAWLLVGGTLRVIMDTLPAGPIYDGLLHSVLLGFVFSMIFGHALIILPAVAHQTVPFKRLFYAHLILLHVSLILRLVGDLGSLLILRQWGGMLNVTAILLFLTSTAYAVILYRRSQSTKPLTTSTSPSKL